MEDFIKNLRNAFDNIGTVLAGVNSVATGNPGALIGNVTARDIGRAFSGENAAASEPTVNERRNNMRILLGGEENWTDGKQDYRAANDTDIYNTDMNPYFNQSEEKSDSGKSIIDWVYEKMQDAYNQKKAEQATDAKESEYDWEYEYKPGDTFGQVLIDLGASDGTNLWGPAGDVAYYTQQLREQDMLDANGNVKLGKKFRLKKRPANV